YNNNTITNIDPVSAAIVKLLPSPNLAGPGGAALLANNYFGKDTLAHSVDQGDVRIDHHLSGANQAFVRYSLLDGTLSQPTVLGMNTWGHTPYAPTQRHDTVFEFIDNVTIIKGKNTIKVGADISHIRASLFQTSNPVGEFDFDQNMTSNAGSGGIGMASFLTG